MKYLLTVFSRYGVRMFHNYFVAKRVPRLGSHSVLSSKA